LECRKIVRRGSFKRKVFTGAGMSEGQGMGVEELAFDPGGPGEGVGAAVNRVAGDRATRRRGVDTDLVGATGEEF